MGVYSSKPDTKKNSMSGRLGSIHFEVSSIKGWRRLMEDQFAAQFSLLPDVHLFGVYDGHGGTEVAEFCKELMGDFLVKNENFRKGNFQEAFEEVFQKIDMMLVTPEGRDLMDTIHKGRGNPRLSGTSAEIVVVTPTHFVLAEIGNSKAYLVRFDKSVEMVSQSHVVQVKAERDRIKAAGGWVSEGRVNDSLIVTRSIGMLDYKMNPKFSPKEQVITAVPNVRVFARDPLYDFILIGTDGTFDLMTPEQVIAKIQVAKDKGYDLKVTIERLLDKLVAKNTESGAGCNNMTLMVICFDCDYMPGMVISVTKEKSDVKAESPGLSPPLESKGSETREESPSRTPTRHISQLLEAPTPKPTEGGQSGPKGELSHLPSLLQPPSAQGDSGAPSPLPKKASLVEQSGVSPKPQMSKKERREKEELEWSNSIAFGV